MPKTGDVLGILVILGLVFVGGFAFIMMSVSMQSDAGVANVLSDPSNPLHSALDTWNIATVFTADMIPYALLIGGVIFLLFVVFLVFNIKR